MADKKKDAEPGFETYEEALDKGYFGEVPDPTPNANYTVDGVTSGKPTPETDPKQADKAEKAARELAEGEGA